MIDKMMTYYEDRQAVALSRATEHEEVSKRQREIAKRLGVKISELEKQIHQSQ